MGRHVPSIGKKKSFPQSMSNLDSSLAESVSTTNASVFIVIYILVLVYCCFGLAVVCDVYFVPALQKLSYTYDLPPDIAGSTLMALGASVPELFASLIGVFVTEDDIGTGSIIGSSCFNLIAVPAACAFVASSSFATKLTSNKDPNGDSGRSSLEHSHISSDSAIGEYKYQNEQAQSGKKQAYLIDGLGYQFVYDRQAPTMPMHEKTPLVGYKQNNIFSTITTSKPCENNINNQHHQQYQQIDLDRSVHLYDDVSIDLGIAVRNSACLIKRGNGINDHHYNDVMDNFEQHADSWLNSLWVLIPLFPITLSLKILTPLKFKNTCWTIWTFFISIVLIGCLTYVSVSMVHLFGKAVGMPETVAGMTILSWGTGIPELIASIVLIKKTAQADMAICNTIGSNVIDASFCLSLPWLVKCLLNRAEGLEPVVAVKSGALPWTCLTLLVSVVLLIIILKLHNWELSFSVGVWLMLTYVAFVFVATYLESTYSEEGFNLFAYI